MTDIVKCKGKVWGLYQWNPCHCKAVTDKGYCKRHDPDIVQTKKDAQYKKYKDRWAAQDKAISEAKEKQAELERRAGCYDELLAALEDCVEDGEIMLCDEVLDKAHTAISKAKEGIKDDTARR